MFNSDVPPPLDDDKTREIDDYELEDDNSSRISTELPEISNTTTNYEMYNSSLMTLKPPDLSAALFFDEPPPDDDYDPSKVSREDSFEDFVYHENISPSKEQDDTVIEDIVGEKSLKSVINDSPVESKLSQFQDTVEQTIETENDKSSRTFDVNDRVKEPLELILSTPDDNLAVNLETEIIEPPPLDSIEITKDPEEPRESDNGAISSFSTSFSLACYDDNIMEENLHSEFTEDVNNYDAKVITFSKNNEHDSAEKINQNNLDVTESIQVTQAFKLDDVDDDDDDFNDFEAAIPVHRTIDTQSSITSFDVPAGACEDVKFEADFSAFNESTENDDDFGDFNDFETAPVLNSVNISQQETIHSIEFVKPANVIGLIAEMFPSDEQQCYDELEIKYESYANNLKSDDIVKKLDDFDATFALGYLYNNSTASQILVKALGIDTRNIVSKKT